MGSPNLTCCDGNLQVRAARLIMRPQRERLFAWFAEGHEIVAVIAGNGRIRPFFKGGKGKEDRRFESPLLQQRGTANHRSLSRFSKERPCPHQALRKVVQ